MTKADFLDVVGNWSNHRNLLWPALELTKHLGLPVLELGSGMGSTKYLRQYCMDEGLEFFSYDSNLKYAEENLSAYVENWDTIPWLKQWGVVLVDEAPGEHRKISLSLLHHAQIVVAHDTEPAAEHGYQMRPELLKYKFLIDWQSEGAWATAVSNYIHLVPALMI